MRWNLRKKSRDTRTAAKRHRRAAFRPGVEALEARELLVSQPLLFSITPGIANSFLTASGHITTSATGGTQFPIQQQGAGSLTSSYTGTINTNFDPIGTPRLQFVQGGTAADATVTGSWQPLPGGAAGSAPADYGGRATINLVFFTANAVFAVRDLMAATSTPGLANLGGTAPNFTFPSNQTLTITNGFADYRATGTAPGLPASGRENLTGNSANNASPTLGQLQETAVGSGRYNLTVPVRVTIVETIPGSPSFTVTLVLQGTIRGTAERAVVDLNGPSAGFDFSTSTFGAGPAVNIAAANATVTRVTAATNLTGATITLTNRPDGADEVLAVTGLPGSFTSSYNPATGVLQISGTGSTAVYQNIVRNITYQNNKFDATPGNRTINVVVRDALNESQVRTSTVTVAPIAFAFADDGSGQASQVRSLTVLFSAAVSASASAFTLTRLGEGGGGVGISVSTSEWAPGLTQATISFTGPGSSVYQLADGSFALTDGNYRLSVNGSLITSSIGGVAVDADFDGTPGGIGTLDFHRLFGDSNGDRFVGDDDFETLLSTYGLTSADPGFLSYFDHDGDGDVDDDDVNQFFLRYGTLLPPA